MKELKLYRHKKEDDVYLLGYLNNNNNITGILLNDSIHNKGRVSSGWNNTVFKEYDNISSGNISITNKVGEVYLDKDNNPVIKCHSWKRIDIYILINSMEEYKGVLKDLKKVDKVIIKVR